jgi:hypothetical protein
VRPGIIFVVIGAILAFAVRAEASAVDLQVVGLIFIVAGAAIMAYSRREKRSAQVLTRVEHSAAGSEEPRMVQETVTREVVIEDDGTSSDQYAVHGYDPEQRGMSGA